MNSVGARLGVRLLHRSTRRVVPTEVGARLLDRLEPAVKEVEAALVTVDPGGPLIVRVSGGSDLAVGAAVAGCGVVHLFEDWLAPHLASGALEPVLKTWWQTFTGPFLYDPGRHHLPAPLRAFVDFVQVRHPGQQPLTDDA